MLKAMRVKLTIVYKEISTRIATDFSTEAMENKRKEDDTF